jgi:Ca2+-binding RTX toxin-like protein
MLSIELIVLAEGAMFIPAMRRSLLALALAFAGASQAAITTSFNNGTLTITSDGADSIDPGCNAGNIALTGTAIAPAVACNAVQQLIVQGGPDANTISLVGVLATDFTALTTITVAGGDGNDTITGTLLADTLSGGNGDDTLIGDDSQLGTADVIAGDDGDDTMIWNPGDDDDINEGGAGNDTAVVNGGNGNAPAETFTIAPAPFNTGRVDFNRTNPAPFFIDIAATERLQVNANGGDDVITGATGLVGLIALELNGGDGNDTITGGDGADLIRGGNNNDTIDGSDNPVATVDQVFGDDGDDTMIWNPGKDDDLNDGGPGTDTSVVNGGGAAETFTIAPDPVNAGRVDFNRTNPAPFFIDIAATERLQVNANGGDDVITGAAGLVTLLALELNGGDGNDTITGGDGADLIRGGNNNDTLIGDDNPATTLDQVFGDDGDDSMTWNPGDDDDLNEGGAGNDTVVVNGGSGAEAFRIAANGARVRFDRTNNAPAPFFLDIGSSESLQLNAAGGADTVTTVPLTGFAQQLDGGDPTTSPGDTLIVVGFTGDASISPIAVPGFGPITHAGFEFDAVAGATRSFTASLDGAQEVPPVDTTGTGRGTVVLNAARDQITVRLSFSGLGGNNTLTHIHGPAAPGANAAPIFDLGNTNATSGTLGPFTFAVTPQQAAELEAGLWYFNVHSTTDQNGEIRGQILADRIFEAFLSGAQEVPPTPSTATGFGTVTLAGPEDQIVVALNYIGLSGNNTLTHIHAAAPRGQNAAPLIDLRVSGATADSFTTNPIAVTPAQVADLKAGRWYFNVHSTVNGGGEIRGQIDNAQLLDGFE